MRTLVALSPEEEERKRRTMQASGFQEGVDFQFDRRYQAPQNKAAPVAAGQPQQTRPKASPLDLMPDVLARPQEVTRDTLQPGSAAMAVAESTLQPIAQQTEVNPLEKLADATSDLYMARVKGDITSRVNRFAEQAGGLPGNEVSSVFGMDNAHKQAQRAAVRTEAAMLAGDDETDDEEILQVLASRMQTPTAPLGGQPISKEDFLTMARGALKSPQGKNLKKELRVVGVGKALQKAADEGDTQTLDDMAEAWSAGLADAHLKLRQSLVSFGIGDQGALDQQFDDLSVTNFANPVAKKGILHNALTTGAGFLGPMAESIAAQAVLNTVLPGSGVAAATLGKMGKVGRAMTVLGSAVKTNPYWFAVSQGDTYRSMIKSGVDEDIALAASIPIGLMVAKIETAQTEQFTDIGAKTWINRKLMQVLPTSSLGQRIGTQLISRAATAATEANEEALQSVVQDVGENITKWIHNEAKADNIPIQQFDEVLKKAVDSWVQTAPAMLLGGFGAGAANIAGEFVGDIQFDREMTKGLEQQAWNQATTASIGAVPNGRRAPMMTGEAKQSDKIRSLQKVGDAVLNHLVDQDRATDPDGVAAFESLVDDALRRGETPQLYTSESAVAPGVQAPGPGQVVIAPRTEKGVPVGRPRPATVVSQKGARVTVRYADGTEQTVDKKRVSEETLPQIGSPQVALEQQFPGMGVAPAPFQPDLGAPPEAASLAPEGMYPPPPADLPIGREATARARLYQQPTPEMPAPGRIPGVDYEARAAWDATYGEAGTSAPAEPAKIDALREQLGARPRPAAAVPAAPARSRPAADAQPAPVEPPAAPVETPAPEPAPSATPEAPAPAAPASRSQEDRNVRVGKRVFAVTAAGEKIKGVVVKVSSSRNFVTIELKDGSTRTVRTQSVSRDSKVQRKVAEREMAVRRQRDPGLTEKNSRAFVEKAVTKYFKGKIPNGIRVVYEPDAKTDGEYSWRRVGDRTVHTITVNAATVIDERHVHEILDHELGHYAYRNDEIAAQIRGLMDSLSKEQRAKITDWVLKNYDRSTWGEEQSVRALEEVRAVLRNQRARMGVVEKIIRDIARLLKESFGIEDAGTTANRVLHAAAGAFVMEDLGVTVDHEAGTALVSHQSIHNADDWEKATRAYMARQGIDQKQIDKTIRNAQRLQQQIKDFGIASELPLGLSGNKVEMGTPEKLGKQGQVLKGKEFKEPKPLSVGGSNPYGPIRTNMDPLYIYSLDMASDCVRRLRFAPTLIELKQQIRKEFGRKINEADIMGLMMVMRDDGHVTPCLYCYVESNRRQAEETLGKWQDALDGNPGPLIDGTKGKNRAEVEEKKAARRSILKQLKAQGITGNDVNVKDIMRNAEAWENDTVLKKPVTYLSKKYNTLNEVLSSLSMANTKRVEAYEEYSGQYLRMPADLVKMFNNSSGVRWFSSSDFVPEHLMDLVQAMTDMSARGLTGHTYTKVEDFVRIFGKTGMKINLSLKMMDGSELDPIGDPQQSFNFERAKYWRKQNPNIGTEMMATSHDQIFWSLDQDWIDYIIPFHRSGFRHEQKAGWQDYSGEQHEVWFTEEEAAAWRKTGTMPDVKWEGKSPDKQKRTIQQAWIDKGWCNKKGEITIRQHHYGATAGITAAKAKANYLSICKEMGIRPVFAGVMKDGKSVVDHPGYIKLKKDYARIDSPLDVVDSSKIDMKASIEVTARLTEDIAKVEANGGKFQQPPAKDSVKRVIGELKKIPGNRYREDDLLQKFRQEREVQEGQALVRLGDRQSLAGLRAGTGAQLRTFGDAVVDARRWMFQPSAIMARKLAERAGKTDPDLRDEMIAFINQFDRGQEAMVGETMNEAVELMKARHILPMARAISKYDSWLQDNWMNLLRTRGPRGGYKGIEGTTEERAKRRRQLDEMRAMLDAFSRDLLERGAIKEFDPNYVPRAYDAMKVQTARNDQGQTFVEFVAEKAVEAGKFEDVEYKDGTVDTALDQARRYAQGAQNNIVDGRSSGDGLDLHDPRRRVAGVAPAETSMLKAREFDFIDDIDLIPWLHSNHEYGLIMGLTRTINAVEFRRRVLGGKWANLRDKMVKTMSPEDVEAFTDILAGWGGQYGKLTPRALRMKMFVMDPLKTIVTVSTMPFVAAKSLGEFGMPMVRAATNNPVQTLRHATVGFFGMLGAVGDKGLEVAFGPQWASKSEARRIAKDIGLFVHGYMQDVMQNRDLGDPTVVTWGDKVTGKFYRGIQLENLTRVQRLMATATAMSFINHAVRVVTRGPAGSKKVQRHLEMLQELGFVRGDMAFAGTQDAQKLLDYIDGKNEVARQQYAQMVLRFVNETIMDPTRQDRPALANHRNPFVQAMYQFQGYGFAARQKIAGRMFDQAKKGNVGPMVAAFAPLLISYLAKIGLDALTGADDRDDERGDAEMVMDYILYAGFLGSFATPKIWYDAVTKWNRDPMDLMQGAFYSFWAKELKRVIQVAAGEKDFATESWNALPIVRQSPHLQKKAPKKGAGGSRGGGRPNF